MLPRIRRVVGERIPDQVKLFARAAQDADESRALQVRPDVVAGHSLGEYGAAYAAGCFDFETGLWLVAERDRFLAEAAEKRRAGWLRSSGPTPRRSRERSARRRARWSQTTTPRARPSSQACATPWATRSPGSGAARCPSTSPSRHTRHVAAAGEKMRGVLDAVEFRKPEVPIVSAIDGSVLTSAGAVKEALKNQMVAPVRWVKVVDTLARMRVEELIELGGGVLIRMLGTSSSPP